MGDAKERVSKVDPSTEIFQMRAQEAKAELCRKAWHDRWHWLVDEGEKVRKEVEEVRAKFGASLQEPKRKVKIDRSLKPVPPTSTGMIGWLASRPECLLEENANWLPKIPIRAPDAWDFRSYIGTEK